MARIVKRTIVHKKKGRIQSDHIVIDGIEFKSKLEGRIYSYLKACGMDAEYEPESFVLWKGGPTRTPFYNAKKGRLRCFKSDLENITYTPDFHFKYGLYDVYIEAKGFENDRFSIIKKLFRKYLDDNSEHSYYFEIRSIEQLKNMIDILQYGQIPKKTRKTKKTEKSR